MGDKSTKTATPTNLSPELEQLRVLTELGVDADTAWRQMCESRDAREERSENHANRSAQRLEETEQVIALLGGVAPAVEAAALSLLKVRDVARKGNLEHMVSSAKAELQAEKFRWDFEMEKAQQERADKLEALKAKFDMLDLVGVKLTPMQKAELAGLHIPQAKVAEGLVAEKTTTETVQETDYSGNLKVTTTTTKEVYGEPVADGLGLSETVARVANLEDKVEGLKHS